MAPLRPPPDQQHHLPWLVQRDHRRRWPAQRRLQPWRARPHRRSVQLPAAAPSYGPARRAAYRRSATTGRTAHCSTTTRDPSRRTATATGHVGTPRAAHRRAIEPGASPTAGVRPSRKEQVETRTQQREQRIQQRQQIVQERQRNMLTRQSTERQPASIASSSAYSNCSRKAGRPAGATHAGTGVADPEPPAPARAAHAADRSGAAAAAGTTAFG